MKIRQAGLSDVMAIAGLSGQLGYPLSPEQMKGHLTMIQRKADHAVLVAEGDEKEVVGWIHVFGTYHLMEQPRVEIGGLVVADGHRSAGIGRALVCAAEAWARAAGFAGMRVRSNMLRQRAHAFYERLGYRCTKTQGHFVKDLE